jgi:hypothetical protein
LIGEIKSADESMQGLLDRLDMDEWMGRPLGGAPAASGASVTGEDLDPLRGPGAVPYGVVALHLDGDVRPGDRVVVEIDGEVVTAAPVSTPEDDPTSYVMVPPGVLGGSEHDVAVALVRDGRLLSLRES